MRQYWKYIIQLFLLVLVDLFHWDTDCGLCGKIFTDHDVFFIVFSHRMTKDMTGHVKQAKLHVGKICRHSFDVQPTLLPFQQECYVSRVLIINSLHVVQHLSFVFPIFIFCCYAQLLQFDFLRIKVVQNYFFIVVTNISTIKSHDSKTLIKNFIMIATRKSPTT